MPDYNSTRQSDYTGLAETLADQGLISKDGDLQEYTGQVNKHGDGKSTVDSKDKDVTISPVYKEFTFKVTNSGDKDLNDIYFTPTIEQMTQTDTGYNFIDESKYLTPISYSGELVYLSAHGEGKSYNNVGTIKAGETKEITVGYILINPENNPVLMNFNLLGNNIDDLNADNLTWMKLPE